MPATRYKIWQMGGAVGHGATRSFHVGVAGVAKASVNGHPHVVANELTCSHLARAVLLPIPPGFIIEHDGAPCFVSLDFNLAGEDLPPADAAAVVAQHPDLSCGIVLFDIWVVNGDRHSRNVAHDRTTERVQIFDHSHAFFSGNDGRSALETNQGNLGIGGHCLARELVSFAGMAGWFKRINSIPEFYIQEVITSAVEVGIPDADKEYCTQYLLDRRKKLLDLVKANRQSFPKIQQGLWDELSEDGGEQ